MDHTLPKLKRRVRCVKCKHLFHRRQGWETKCFDCWIAAKTALDHVRGLERNIDRLENQIGEVHKLEQTIRRLRREIDDLRRLRDLPRDPGEIPTPMLRRLLQLAHPDRHQNSKAANDATTWLLAQRSRKH